MAILNFPADPQQDDQYTGDNGTTYIYDGVKWIGRASGTAGTNSIQNSGFVVQVDSDGDLVTPTFTIPNTAGTSGQVLKWPGSGSTLTWGADSSTSNKLVNGLNEAVLNSDGSITLPTMSTLDWDRRNLVGPTLQMGNDPTVSDVVITGPTPNLTNPNAVRLIIQGQQGFELPQAGGAEGGDVYIWAGHGGEGNDFSGNGGDVKLRGGIGGLTGGYIRLESGDANALNGTGGFLDLNAGNATNTNGYGGSVNIRAGTGDGAVNGGNVGVYTNNGVGNWQFKPDGSFALNNNEVHIATNNWGISAPDGVNTVVYTAKQNNLASIRVHATIEGVEDGDTTGNHSQACDMMIVRRQSTLGVSTVDSVVYGVIYTGTGPLATLDAQWNAVTSKIEITATPVNTTPVYVKIYATEVARGD